MEFQVSHISSLYFTFHKFYGVSYMEFQVS